MPRGPGLQELKLTSTERERLLEWTRRHKSAQALALRSRIVLAAADGHTNRAVAHQLRVTGQTVGKWRSRFLQRRLDGLLDEPRPGAPRQIGDQQVEALIAKTLHERPESATHWSSRLMAEASGLSQTALVRIWHAFGDCSRIAPRLSSSPPIRCSSRRSGISSVCILIRRRKRWCCASTRRARSRRSIGRNRCCQ